MLLLAVTALACAPRIHAAAANEHQNPQGADTVRREYPVMNYNRPQTKVINDVTIHGVYVIDPMRMAADIGIIKGDTVTIPGPYITTAVNKLINRQQYAAVDIVAVPVEGSQLVDLEIHLTDQPRVRDWNFEGIRKGQISDLRDKMQLRQGMQLSQYDVNKHKNYIREYYKEKGFRNAEVDMRIKQDDEYPTFVNVTFVIDRGEKVKIGQINFTGNEEFADKRLRRQLKNTHMKNWNIFQGAKLKDKKYEEDKGSLIDFYNSKGYRNAHIVNDSIYYVSPNRLGIDIDLSEGNRYYYRNITWIGNTVYPAEYLNAVLAVEPGAPYDKKALTKRLEGESPDDFSVSSLYQNNGYLFSQIEPSEIIIGKDSIDLELKIFEGKQARINRVEITGNERVDDEVIRRELDVSPGDLYSREILMGTLRRLMGMQHFNPETLQPGFNTPTNELVDITFPLEEVASDRFEISGGWGAGQFIGSIGIQLNNLAIGRFFKKGQWRPYPQGKNQSLALRAQSNGKYYSAFSLSFTEPWMGGKKPVSLQIGAHYSSESNANYWTSSNPTKHFNTLGVSAGVGRRLSWPDPNFTLYNELAYQAYILDDWDGFIVENGSSNMFTFTSVFGRSTINNPIFPSSGSSFSLSLALTPPYSLFDNRDYSKTMSNRERYGWIEYHKWKLKGEWYTPLTKGNKPFVLMAKAEMGYLGHYNKNRESPFEGFDLGGSGMTGYNVYGVEIIGLRGYDDSALTPAAQSATDSNYARVYNKITFELRYPVIMQPGTQIYGLIFAEGGNAYRNWKEFNPFHLKRSVGAGVRINLQIVGMIGFDWGWGFDNPVGSNKRSGGKIAFTFGQQF